MLSRLMGRLSVGRKLMLIYLLDLSAVIFVSGILIHEKFIAIDFARKELVGEAYIADAASVLLRAAQGGPRRATSRPPSGMATACRRASWAAPGAGPAQAVGRFDGTPDAAAAGRHRARARAGHPHRQPVQPHPRPRPGQLLHDVPRAAALPRAAGARDADQRRCSEADSALCGADAAPATWRWKAAWTPPARHRVRLRRGLRRRRLAAAGARAAGAGQRWRRPSSDFRDRNRATPCDSDDRRPRGRPRCATLRPAGALDAPGARQPTELDRLLQARIDGFFTRMWLHLGTALSAAGADPDRRVLRRAADRAAAAAPVATWPTPVQPHRRPHAARALGQPATRSAAWWRLQRHAGRSSTSSAPCSRNWPPRARAAQAQQQLVEAMPIPLMVTADPRPRGAACQPARAGLAERPHDRSRGRAALEPAVRARFFQQLADRDARRRVRGALARRRASRRGPCCPRGG